MHLCKKRLVPVVLAALVAGCSATSEQVTAAHPLVAQKPDVIVVYPFAVDPEDVTLNQGFFESTYRNVAGKDETAEQHDIAQNAAEDICLEVATALMEKGHKAVCQQRGVPVPGNSIVVVDGAFTNLSAGNRLKRMVIGFGAGASVMDTNVEVLHRTHSGMQKLLGFNTHADSGKQPGMAVMGPAGAAVGPALMVANAANMATKAHRSSFGRLQDRTADAIVEQLTTYFDQHGWSS
jgi:Domain of unknown function (DUF4410)